MTWCDVKEVAPLLASEHYLGPGKRGFAFSTSIGCMVFAKPSSRRLPADGTWLELTRWCIRRDVGSNAGTRGWAQVATALRFSYPNVTTVVSYSDPSVGHTGSLYRACNWLWAPTWHRLRPPPSGNGKWNETKVESVKDRWVYLLAPDDRREALLAVQDMSIRRKHPEWSYREPKWKRGKPQSGGGDFKAWKAALPA